MTETGMPKMDTGGEGGGATGGGGGAVEWGDESVHRSIGMRACCARLDKCYLREDCMLRSA